ncbi:MAG TPA: thymidylate kinase [Candidatus Angelobacter sp.]|nr:thymidylate kinase [Candidatus Angelobacter sp.]
MAGSVEGRPLVISFSGLDGAGKSTQMENLRQSLENAGFRTKLLTFWDDVVVGVKYREGFVHKVYKSERGVGAPGKPVARRDKNVRAWYLTIARSILYLLDAIHLRRVLTRSRHSDTDVILVDRYIYDELANLNLTRWPARVFVRLVRSFVPVPDIAYLLDADPEAAYARKPEYPVDFMRQCRASYFELARLLGTMVVVPPLDMAQARDWVLHAAGPILDLRGGADKAWQMGPASLEYPAGQTNGITPLRG